jgi:hypothetical protein
LGGEQRANVRFPAHSKAVIAVFSLQEDCRFAEFSDSCFSGSTTLLMTATSFYPSLQ